MSATRQEALDFFNAQLAAKNEAEPRDHDPPHFLANYRHKCPAQNNVSKAIDCKEIYETDEAYPDFAFIYRQGSCRKCNQVARSSTGRIVIAADRPPISGRVSRA